ncbi:MAG: FAD-dependent thymidylate synthase [Clostridia bacterium]|nr:FAD-dependent thymidylate synthase [Clostridia bacterium]
MNNSRAIIVVENRDALRVAASSARISTQQGTAMEIFERSLGDERDLKLIDKVLSSGHKSVIEHQTFGVAFDNVSVLVEQFVIEARLASYTVKSRRYVDFSNAGCVRPANLEGELAELYDQTMADRFGDYEKLMALGVPKEDARFVLPYSLRSNFFMTVNARELIALVCAMLQGRGAGFGEIESLGTQLKTQFDARYPGVIDGELHRRAISAPMPLPTGLKTPWEGVGDAELISAPADARGLLSAALAFSGRFGAGEGLTPERVKSLLTDARPRELEMLNYAFRIKGISLACLTHFARHRIQSSVIPPVLTALAGGRYVLPDSVRANPAAESVYRGAFSAQTDAAQRALSLGLSAQDAGYFAMSGHQLDILMSMNARELLHFMKLRTCARAQWEIRGVAGRMLALLQEELPELFGCYGASCRLGPCPEGKMSCGNPQPRAWP